MARAIARRLVFAAIFAAAAPALADPPPRVPTPPAAAAPARVPEAKTLQSFVNSAIIQAFDELRLAGAEKQLFESEVIPASLQFASNYRTTADGTDVQIDRDKLRNYLKFSGALFSSVEGRSICVLVRTENDCAACEALRPGLQAAFSARLARRGFTVKPGPAMPEGSALTGDRAFDDYAARGAEARCEGMLYAELNREHTPEENDEDEDVQIRSGAYLLLRDRAQRKVRSAAKANVQVPASVETATAASRQQFVTAIVARQTADLFSQASARASTAAARMAESQGERYLRLEGVTRFADYAKFKQTVASALPDVTLEERFISPGVFQFLLGGSASRNLVELGRQLGALSWGPQTLEVVKVATDELAVVLK